MSCEVSQLGFPIHKGNENVNPMTIYMPLRWNLFLVLVLCENIFFLISLQLCPVVATIWHDKTVQRTYSMIQDLRVIWNILSIGSNVKFSLWWQNNFKTFLPYKHAHVWKIARWFQIRIIFKHFCQMVLC